MSMVKRPMKAPGEPITNFQLKGIDYPLYGSPKLDGIRALADGTQVLSASLKRIGNQHVQDCLGHPRYRGLDGELVVGLPYCVDEEDDVFYRTSGPIRKRSGQPDFKFYVFDHFANPKAPYESRWVDYVKNGSRIDELEHVVVLEQRLLNTPEEVLEYEAECVAKGYEGIMIRSGSAHYKEGRATLKEELIFKRKPIADDEAEIVGFYEQLENLNEKVVNELGTSSRSGHKENKVPKGTLGGFILKSDLWDDTFNCGTIIGGTIAFRKEVWENQDKYLGKIVKYKYQKYGSIDKPRQPRMKGFRDLSDMTEY